MALTNGQKIGLVAVAGVGAFLLAGGSGKEAKAATSAPPLDCKIPKDCAQLTTCATAAMATATKTDIPALQTMKATADKLGCTDLSKQLGTLISTFTKTVNPVPPPAAKTGTFDASKALSPREAHRAALAIGNATAPSSAPPSAVASNGTFNTLADYMRYGGNPGHVLLLQTSAGITPDGKYGPNTQAAFNYWFWNTARPDGSTDVRVSGSVGSEGGLRHNHVARVGSESVAGCSACEARSSTVGQSVEIHNPESFGMYNTVEAHDEGYVKFDRAFGSQFGAGPANGPLARSRVFGRSSVFGR